MLNRRASGLLALLLAIALSSSCMAQEQTRFVLKLNDDLASNLRNFGTLSSNVDEKFRQRISMVEIQYVGGVDGTATTSDQKLVLSNDVANISVTETMINQLKSGPIRIMVPAGERSFSKIALNYEVSQSKPAATVENKVNSTGPILNDSGQPMDTFFIRMNKSDSMSGGIDGLEQVKFTTRFGDVAIPMDQIAGIKFHVDNRDSAVVVLNNGDSITGVPELQSISLKTDWGVAEIEPEFIDALTTTANAKFQQTTTDFGLRWELKTGDSFAPGPTNSVRQ